MANIEIKRLTHQKDAVALFTRAFELYGDIKDLLVEQNAMEFSQSGDNQFVDADPDADPPVESSFPVADGDVAHLDRASYYAAVSALSSIVSALDANSNKGLNDLARGRSGTNEPGR